ncbi:MAG: arylsulfatase family protein, partial [Paenibacillus sp.]|nr:arylsulfatase family protein [Paenibacillus sp.]
WAIDPEFPTPNQLNLKNVRNYAGIDARIGYRTGSYAVLQQNGNPSVPIKRAHESYFVAEGAKIFLQDRQADGRKFVLQVDTWGPHHPYFIDPETEQAVVGALSEYPNFQLNAGVANRPEYHKDRINHWNEISEMSDWSGPPGTRTWEEVMRKAYQLTLLTDNAVYEVLEKLDQTGLADSTVVILTADNGDILGSNGAVFDKDAIMTEETVLVPLVIRWPGVTDVCSNGQKGCAKKSDSLVTTMDIPATVLDLMGQPVPEHMHGRSLKPLLLGQTPNLRTELMIEHFGHTNQPEFQRALYYENYKFVAHKDDLDELYDLNTDPYEMNNLINDPNSENLVLQMEQKLIAQMNLYEDYGPDALELRKQLNNRVKDYFNDHEADGWEPISGLWKIVNKQYRITSGDEGDKTIYVGQSNDIDNTPVYADFIFDADLSFVSGKPVKSGPIPNAGIMFRANNINEGPVNFEGYTVLIVPGKNDSGNKVKLVKMNGATETVIAEAPLTVNYHTAYHVKVRAKGNTFRIYVGETMDEMNTPLIDYTDLDAVTYSSGSVGFRVVNATAQFDNINVD